MKRITLLASAMVALIAVGDVCAKDATAEAKTTEQAVKKQTLCPIMGGEVNKNLFVDYQGKRIYVCCKGCIGTVKKDPAKYIALLEKEGITLDKTPAADTAKKTKKQK